MKLWGGETASQVGTQVTVLAMPLAAIVTLKATPEQLGLLTAAQFVPVLLVTLFAGVWLDCHRRKPILLGANVGRAVALGLIPILYATGGLTMVALYAIALVAGTMTAVFDVAYLVYLPSLVPPERLVEANAKLEGTYSIAQVGGPGLGGLLVQAVTAPVAILLDAASYVVAAISVVLIEQPEPRFEPPAQRVSVLGEIRQGLAATLGNSMLLPLVAQSGWFNLFQQAVLTLYLLYGVRNLHLSAALIGLILAIGGLGGLVGTFVATRVGRRLGVGGTLAASMILASAALALIPAASGSKPVAALTLTVGFLLFGFGLSIFNVYSLSLRAALVPGELLARVMATYRFIAYGAIPIGALLGGFLGHVVGVRSAMVIAVMFLVAGSLGFATSPIRRASVPVA